jgi:hypothetical protein
MKQRVVSTNNMMKMLRFTSLSSLLLFSFLFLLISSSSVQAFSTGTGSCAAGTSSATGSGSIHFNNAGGLSNIGASLSIESVFVPENNVIVGLQSGLYYNFMIQGDIKGLFLRFESMNNYDLTGVVTPNSTIDFYSSVQCVAPVIGIQHNSAVPKRDPQFQLDTTRIPPGTSLTFDIVVVNTPTDFYYSNYTIRIFAAPTAPSPDRPPNVPTIPQPAPAPARKPITIPTTGKRPTSYIDVKPPHRPRTRMMKPRRRPRRRPRRYVAYDPSKRIIVIPSSTNVTNTSSSSDVILIATP